MLSKVPNKYKATILHQSPFFPWWEVVRRVISWCRERVTSNQQPYNESLDSSVKTIQTIGKRRTSVYATTVLYRPTQSVVITAKNPAKTWWCKPSCCKHGVEDDIAHVGLVTSRYPAVSSGCHAQLSFARVMAEDFERGLWNFERKILVDLGAFLRRHEWKDLLWETASERCRKGFRISAEIHRQTTRYRFQRRVRLCRFQRLPPCREGRTRTQRQGVYGPEYSCRACKRY